MYTRLDIINEMIASTGARALTAEQTNHPLYRKAAEELRTVSNSVVTLNLWFNTQVRSIQPQTDGTIIVPNGCVSADPVDRKCNLTLRQGKLFDLNTGSFYVGGALTLRMKFDVSLEDMPLSALMYVKDKAVYKFYLDEDGTDPKLTEYRNISTSGWSLLYAEHLRHAQLNVFDSPSNMTQRLRGGTMRRNR